MPTNLEEESEIVALTRHVRDQLTSKWIHTHLDLKEMAEEGNMAYKTVYNFLHYVTRRPLFETVVKIATVLNIRITAVNMVAKMQPDEIRVSRATARKIRDLEKEVARLKAELQKKKDEI